MFDSSLIFLLKFKKSEIKSHLVLYKVSKFIILYLILLLIFFNFVIKSSEDFLYKFFWIILLFKFIFTEFIFENIISKLNTNIAKRANSSSVNVELYSSKLISIFSISLKILIKKIYIPGI